MIRRILHFGRAARTYDPRFPHASAVLSRPLFEVMGPAAPSSANYVDQLDPDFGDMRNVGANGYNDCTCAAYYHARQVWTRYAQGAEVTEPDNIVLQLYDELTGMAPGQDGPGPSVNSQTMLAYLINTGAPLQNGARSKLLACFELDHRVPEDVKLSIDQCGVVYVGFPMMQSIIAGSTTWDYVSGDMTTGDGHAAVLVGYDATGADVISWGRRYRMTWSFLTTIVDEVYALVDPTWVQATGVTPLGLTVDQLRQQMQAIAI